MEAVVKELVRNRTKSVTTASTKSIPSMSSSLSSLTTTTTSSTRKVPGDGIRIPDLYNGIFGLDFWPFSAPSTPSLADAPAHDPKEPPPPMTSRAREFQQAQSSFDDTRGEETSEDDDDDDDDSYYEDDNDSRSFEHALPVSLVHSTRTHFTGGVVQRATDENDEHDIQQPPHLFIGPQERHIAAEATEARLSEAYTTDDDKPNQKKRRKGSKRMKKAFGKLKLKVQKVKENHRRNKSMRKEHKKRKGQKQETNQDNSTSANCHNQSTAHACHVRSKSHDHQDAFRELVHSISSRSLPVSQPQSPGRLSQQQQQQPSFQHTHWEQNQASLTSEPPIPPAALAASIECKAPIDVVTYHHLSLEKEKQPSTGTDMATFANVSSTPSSSLHQHWEKLDSMKQEVHVVRRRLQQLEQQVDQYETLILQMEDALNNSLHVANKQLTETQRHLMTLEQGQAQAMQRLEQEYNKLTTSAGDKNTEPSSLWHKINNHDDGDLSVSLESTEISTTSPNLHHPTERLQRSRSHFNQQKGANRKTKPFRKPSVSSCSSSSLVVVPESRCLDAPSYIRVHDLEINHRGGGCDASSSSGESSASSPNMYKEKEVAVASPGAKLINLDQSFRVGPILDALIRYGYDIATDESKRFVPVQNTERLLKKTTRQKRPSSTSWSFSPWHEPPSLNDVLVWQGYVEEDGPAKHLPLIKARGIVCTSPETLLEFLLDSSRVGEYNKMSLGRRDVDVLQRGIDTSAVDSSFGIAGEAKIVQSTSRVPIVRQSIGMQCLIYARKDEKNDGSYIAVSRSVWANEAGTEMAPTIDEKNSNGSSSFQSEVHLGVNLLRRLPDSNYCELTTVTQVHTSIVPQMLAERAAPTHAVGFIKSIQSIFSK